MEQFLGSSWGLLLSGIFAASGIFMLGRLSVGTHAKTLPDWKFVRHVSLGATGTAVGVMLLIAFSITHNIIPLNWFSR